ncbi:MAG: hypothetical protein Q9159_001665 [Coniocarpon cinnabarinum]
MKVILSGATGYIGGQVLTNCLNHPSITTAVILTRRNPGDIAKHSKAKLVTVSDFTSYDESTIKELQDADAAIWCIGTNYGDERIDVDFPLAFLNAIKRFRTPASLPFRYVQLGGAFTEPPPPKSEDPRALWFFANGRRVRGMTEARVLGFAEDNEQCGIEVYLVKPGGVVPSYASLLQRIFGNTLSVCIGDLGNVMADLAVNGHEQKAFSNAATVQYAKRLQESTA